MSEKCVTSSNMTARTRPGFSQVWSVGRAGVEAVVGSEMLIVERSGGVVRVYVWFNKTCDGRHSLGDPTDTLYLFSVSLHHVLS